MQHQVQPRQIASTPHAIDPDLFIAAQLAERLRHAAARLSPCLAQAAWQLTRAEAWKRFGFANAQDFARERLDHSGRWLRDLARLGQAVHKMPALADALTGADGAPPLGRAAALEICRIARPETLAIWVQRARQCTIRTLKEWIRQETAHSTVPASRGARRVIHLAVSDAVLTAFDEVEQVFLATNPGGTRTAFVEALLAERASSADGALPAVPTKSPSRPGRRKPLRRVDLKPSTDAILAEARSSQKEILLARWALQHVQTFAAEMNTTTSEATRSPEQALHNLQAALALVLRAGLEALATAPVTNVFLRLDLDADLARDLRQCLNQTRVDLQARCQHLGSAADEARLFPSIRLAHRCVMRGQPIPDGICLLSLLEEFAEEWDNPRNMPRRPTDAITSRDGWRCTAPGCTAREVEVHHVVYQSQGGSDDPSNLTSLCPFHHRMGEHGGRAKVVGKAPLGLRWRLGAQRIPTLYENEVIIPSTTTNSEEIHKVRGDLTGSLSESNLKLPLHDNTHMALSPLGCVGGCDAVEE